MAKKSKQLRPKDLPKGSLAHKLSVEEAGRRNANTAGKIKVAGALALAGTLVGLGMHQLDKMDKAHKQNVAEEAAKESMSEGRMKSVDVNTNVYLREGVTVRTEPKIIRGREEDRGNQLFSVGQDRVLVVSNPVQVENEDGEGFMMFTLDDGRTGYVANEIIGQEDPEGNRYAIVAPEQQPKLPDELDVSALQLDEETGAFTIDGHEVATAQFMSPEEALEHMA